MNTVRFPRNGSLFWPGLIAALLSMAWFFQGGCSSSTEPVNQRGPVIAVQPASVSFEVPFGLGSAQDSVTVINTGTDSLVFTASSPVGWLIVEAQTADKIFLRVSAGNLPVGVLTDSLVINSPNALNAPVFVPVTMTVVDRLTLSDSVLQFAALNGSGNPASQAVTVASAAGTAVNFQTSHRSTWLSVTPSSGITPQVVSLDVEVSSLPAGLFRDTVVVTSPDLPGYARHLVVVLSLSSWQQASGIPSSIDLQGMFFRGSDTGWVTGFVGNASQKEGWILPTVDGGATFSTQEAFVHGGAGLGDLTFLSSTVGIAVGDSATILRTLDGGSSWIPLPRNQLPVDSSVDFWRIAGLDERTAILIGTEGTILRTTDSGRTWIQRVSNSPFSLGAVSFTNDQHGWIAGNRGFILRTTDGGLSWETLTSGTSLDLWGISFVDDQKGWVAGEAGIILKTVDGGVSWQMISSGVTSKLRNVCFVDSLYGWAVGLDGVILHTLDGGETWVRQETGLSNILFGVYFMDRQTGWVTGNGGVVLRTRSGGF